MEIRYSLLIVDDETAILETYSSYFGKRGFDVVTAKNGHEGLAALNEYDFDVAIVDINMPRMSGLEMVERAEKLNLDTSFVVLTGHGEKDDAIRGINIGIEGWFEKASIEMDKLHSKVVELAEGVSLDEVKNILLSIPEEG